MKRLFSTDTDSGAVSVFNLRDHEVEPIEKIVIGNGPRGAVRFTSDGRGYVANHAGDTISEIDAYSLRETARIKVGVAPIGVAIMPGDAHLIVSNAGDNSVSIVDLNARQELHRVPVGREPRHPDINPKSLFAYVPISGADSVSILDLRPLADGTPEKVREIKRIYIGAGSMPYSAIVSPDGRYVVSANNQLEYVSIIATETNEVVHKVDLGSKGARGTTYSPDSSTAFVTIEDTSEMAVIDLDKGIVVKKLETGPGPRGVVFDPDDWTIYASAFARTTKPVRSANSVTVIDLGGFRTLRALQDATPRMRDISVGAGPCSVSIFNLQGTN